MFAPGTRLFVGPTEEGIVLASPVSRQHQGIAQKRRAALGHLAVRVTLTRLPLARVHTGIGHELPGALETLRVANLAGNQRRKRGVIAFPFSF